jgi:hypothetical protein
MSTELLIILMVLVFFLFPVFMKTGPKQVFAENAPKLGARMERQIETGAGFTNATLDRGLDNAIQWNAR